MQEQAERMPRYGVPRARVPRLLDLLQLIRLYEPFHTILSEDVLKKRCPALLWDPESWLVLLVGLSSESTVKLLLSRSHGYLNLLPRNLSR